VATVDENSRVAPLLRVVKRFTRRPSVVAAFRLADRAVKAASRAQSRAKQREAP
jgi:hypothetical protein